jgi:hypothetical protein
MPNQALFSTVIKITNHVISNPSSFFSSSCMYLDGFSENDGGLLRLQSTIPMHLISV